ncbi:molecular chaperone [Oceanicoccus sp. KOV_DT_Chl]|uniref:molecular chaperone n=1 Tax=Oceanicoccus sp. KOV_DT_Chl TaxID=1904639 RepID=UPI000C7B2BAD|nr:molecular chaperone [Oceanicoccus sp. KOV_DT_Chl]
MFPFSKPRFSNHLFINTAIIFALNFFPALNNKANAESVLQILPTRVVLEKQRSMTVTLVNRGDDEGNYRLFMRNIRAEDNGKFREITEQDEILDGELFSDKMIRFSPRRVTVPARSKQQVRIVLRKPKDLATGEYRSHLVFRKLPKQESVLDDNDSEMDFTLKPIVEVTIPVIVRHGELEAKATIDNIALITDADNKQHIELNLHRQGNRSLYGDLDIWWTAANAKKQRVAYAKGLAVYVPNNSRKITISPLPEFTLSEQGTLQVEFTEDAAYGGNETATASKSW